MPSKLYKILPVQIGETEGANNRRNKQTLDVGRIIKHEANGNEWMSVQIDAAHLGPDTKMSRKEPTMEEMLAAMIARQAVKGERWERPEGRLEQGGFLLEA